MKPLRPEIIHFIIFLAPQLFQLKHAKQTLIAITITITITITIPNNITITIKNLPAMCSHRTQPSSPQSCVWPLDPRMKAGTATLIISYLRTQQILNYAVLFVGFW